MHSEEPTHLAAGVEDHIWSFPHLTLHLVAQHVPGTGDDGGGV